MPKLKATHDTFLKSSVAPAGDISDADKIFVKAGTEVEINWLLSDRSQHDRIELKTPQKGKYNWYVFKNHFEAVGSTASLSLPSAKLVSGKFFSKVKSAIGLVPQPDQHTCQSATLAMVIGTTDVWSIRADLVANGTAGDPANMGRILRKHFGDRYRFDDNASLSEARDAVKNGAFLIVHGFFSGSGHLIAIDGVEVDPSSLSYKFKVLDPYSQFNAKTWAYDLPDIGYSGYYSSRVIYAACVAGASKWDAQAIYRRGELDSNRKGGWIHFVYPE